MDDRLEAKLRGPVRSIRTDSIFYNSKQGSSQEPHHSSASEQYLPDGRLAERSNRYSDCSETRTEYRYNNRSLLQEQLCWLNAKSCGSTAYLYDGQERLTKVITKTAEGAENTTETYSYDAQGAKSKTRYGGGWSFHTPKGITVGMSMGDDLDGFMVMGATSVTTAFDEDGREQDTVAYDAEHRPMSKLVRHYDQRGRSAEITMVSTSQNSNVPKGMQEMFATAPEAEQQAIKALMDRLFGQGAVLGRTGFQYDDQGRIIERTGGFGPFPSERTARTYNAHGDGVSITTYSEAHEFSLDDGDLIKVPRDKPVGSVEYHFIYVYDDHRNWIEKRSLTLSGSPRVERLYCLDKRELTYW